MSVYEVYSPNPSDGYRCPICFGDDSSKNQGTIAHTGRGQLHPLHKTCAKLWLANHDTCPNCLTQIDKTSLFSWKERYLSEASCIAGDACKGAAASTIGGLAGATLKVALGAALPIGRPEAYERGGGIGIAKLLNIRSTKVKTIISKIAVTLLMSKIIESVTMTEFPIIENPIIASAIVGAVAKIAFGVFERHWL